MMRIRIIDWSYHNLRIGQGDESIKLGNPPKRWSLVQMPNGTGKTTTMELIRAVLAKRQFSASEVRSFRATDEVTEGEFELGLLIQESDSSPELIHRLTLKFDFVDGTFHYSTLRPAERGGGREPGRVLPDELARLLSPNFINLFVFDGELAKNIRDLDKQAADQAIKTLYQLNELRRLREEVKDIVQTRQSAVSGSTSKTKKGVVRHINTVTAAEKNLDRLENELDELKAKKRDIGAKRAEIQKQINARIAENEDLQDEKEKIDDSAANIKDEMQVAISETISAYRSPISLSSSIRDSLTLLGQTLTDVKLPQSVSAEFFLEMSKLDKCICGREIGDEERKTIAQGKDKYLASDQISAISVMKSMLNENGAPDLEFTAACTVLAAKMEDRKTIETRKAHLIQSLEDQAGKDNPSLHKALGEKDSMLDQVEDDITKLETHDRIKHEILGCTRNSNIPLAQKYLDECQDLLTTVTNSFKLTCQHKHLDIQLKRIEEIALRKHREVIREETNKRLSSLVQMEKLQVARIDGALQLTSDKVEERTDVSEGQSLSVAYAFLTSLLAEAPFDLPFVVDSPAVSLDLDVRREVANIIPDLFNQMILFVISSEQTDFADTFYKRDDTHYVSLRKNVEGGIDCVYGLEEFIKRIGENEIS